MTKIKKDKVYNIGSMPSSVVEVLQELEEKCSKDNIELPESIKKLIRDYVDSSSILMKE